MSSEVAAAAVPDMAYTAWIAVVPLPAESSARGRAIRLAIGETVILTTPPVYRY